MSKLLMCGVCVLCACMCVLCVRDMYIQRCRHELEQTHIHILIQTLMYVEVWNIMVCNQNVPDPNKLERNPDVVRESRDGCRIPGNTLQKGGKDADTGTRTHADIDFLSFFRD